MRQALEASLTLQVRRGQELFRVEADLGLEQGVLVLFGPSGAGKSLTLKALAGLIRPRAGSVRVGGELLYDSELPLHVPTHQRRIGYVPQHDSLFPFLNVRGNVAFGLPRRERRREAPRIRELLEELGIAHLADAGTESLSGGERQRVALARALAVRPRLLLLDEPFAAIDRQGRQEIRQGLLRALESHGTPAVFVTHDLEEALAVGTRAALFERGRTVASGDPAELLQPGSSSDLPS